MRIQNLVATTGVLLLGLGTAAMAQTSILACDVPSGEPVVWKVTFSPGLTVQRWDAGQWTANICDQYHVVCEAKPAQYEMIWVGPDRGDYSYATSQWIINRTDGSYRMRRWPGLGPDESPTEERRGICRPSQEPAAVRPIF